MPPGRFEDPVALPNDYRYEAKEYIQESICQYPFCSFCSYYKNPGIDATQPSNDGQAQGNIWSTVWEHLLKFFCGGPFEDKVGFGKPSENPYVADCLSI